MNKKIFFFMVLSVFILTFISAQAMSDSKILIAIPDLKPLSNKIDTDTLNGVWKELETQVSNVASFQVLEREQANKLFEELQSEMTALSDTGASLDIEGANAIIIGNLGVLYDKLILTTRLVDLSSGRILFANSVYMEQNADKIKLSIQSLASAISKKAMELNEQTNLESVKKQVQNRNFGEAKRLIEILIRRSGTQVSTETTKLYEQIVDGLAEENFKNAQNYLNRNLFDKSTELLDIALSLKTDERYYSLREQIKTRQDQYNFNTQLEESRREEALRLQEKYGYVSPFKAVGDYFDSLQIDGFHLGASYSLPINQQNLSVSVENGDFGLDALWILPVIKGDFITSWTSYISASTRYERDATAGNLLFIELGASPFISQTVKVGNFMLSAGLNGGGILLYGAVNPQGYISGFSGGASLVFDIKAIKSFGIFASGKLDYRYYPDSVDRSALVLRLTSGLVF